MATPAQERKYRDPTLNPGDEAYFKAAGEGKLMLGKCKDCGKVHHYRGIKVVCTYHPAFLLRSPAFKKETWEDMKFLMREMGTPVD